MKFARFLLAALPVGAFALEHTLERRVDNAPKIIADLNRLNGDFQNLNKELNTFPDSGPIPLATEFQLEADGNKIKADFQTLANDVQTSTKVSKAQATKIISAGVRVKNSLATLGKNLVAHKQAFDNAGLTSTIVSSLQSYQSAVKSACADLRKKTGSSQAKKLEVVCNQISAILAKTIKGLQS